MAFWNRKPLEERVADELMRRAEETEDRSQPHYSDAEALIGKEPYIFGPSSAGVQVTTHKALSVPAVWTAVNFLAGTLAGLPLHVYRRTEDGREQVEGGMATILHDAPNDEWTSFAWRQYIFSQCLTEGRSYSYIERNVMGRVINIWPLETDHMVVERVQGRKRYRYTDRHRTIIYEPSEIIDIPFLLDIDQIDHHGPVHRLRNTIGLAIALEEYGARFFQNGGVPPLSLEGPFESPGGAKRASAQIWEAVKGAFREKRNVLPIPIGHQLKAIGFDPEKGQMTEVRRFQIEEVARIYSMPPVFLQDLTHGTYSNTEQQDLHFVKHTLKRWIEHFEQELNLKLFGRRNRSQYVEMDVDGLLRGDFKTRMEGYALGIQNAILKPNEARRKENRPDDPKGNDLLVQGATVPLGMQTQTEPASGGNQPPEPNPEADTDE